jgi:hypothetical protein
MSSVFDTPRGRILKALISFLSFAADGIPQYSRAVPLGTPPRVSQNRKLTRGVRLMSSRERANLRKAKRRS